MIRPRGPLGAVALVLGAWVGIRSGAVYWLSGEAVLAVPERMASLAAPAARSAPPLLRRAGQGSPGVGMAPASLSPVTARPAGGSGASAASVDLDAGGVRADLFAAAGIAAGADAFAAPAPLPPSPSSIALARGSVGNLNGSAWALVRGGGGTGLAAGGQLGGSQSGVRLRYSAGDSGVALFGRVSAPLAQRLGKEAAFGLEWQPLDAVPLRFAAERRVGLDRGGRDAFAIGLIGGVDQLRLPARFRLDAYAQTGVVGGRSRDAYVDGQVRVERPLLGLGALKLSAGGGVWGAAQPGLSRLDVGPQLVLRAPVADRTLRINFDWRQRVAGDARPGSGAALTLATDF